MDKLHASSPTVKDYGEIMLTDAPSSTIRVSSDPEPATARVARRILGMPLTILLGGLGVVQLLAWLPHYLTWPFWADHDVFATAARAWSEGRLPYRDTFVNNFPGTIYLFAILGRVAGWGRPSALYGFDASLLVGFLGILITWSRVRFGRVLPGIVGGLCFLGYYLTLDYAHAAQRDWHGPAFASASVLILQCRSTRSARIASGLLAALAVAFRPQTVLWLPAIALAGGSESAQTGRGKPLAEWMIAFVGGLCLAILPLAMAGVVGDFIESVGLTAYGGAYNKVTPTSLIKGWLGQASAWRWWSVAGGVFLLGSPFADRPSRTALPWLLALFGVSWYKPMSPMAHSYLDIPMVLVWSICVACLIGLVLRDRTMRPEWQLATLLLTLGLGTSTLRPEFCRAGPAIHAMRAWLGENPSTQAPPGYRKGTVPTSAFYDWNDYRATLDYLKRATTPQTLVANVLKGDPAITSMVDRLSVFPAESVAWLRMVRPEDEGVFASALERAGDSVVVWCPGEVGPDPTFTLAELTSVIQRNYHHEATFGVIEVWRRNGL